MLHKLSKFNTDRVTSHDSTDWSITIFIMPGMKILPYNKNFIWILRKLCVNVQKRQI